MADNKATAPVNILRKSNSRTLTLEEKLRQMEERLDRYACDLADVQSYLSDLYDPEDTEKDSDYDTVAYTPFTISWMPDNPPRVTQRDREIALLKKRTREEHPLYCHEEIKDF